MSWSNRNPNAQRFVPVSNASSSSQRVANGKFISPEDLPERMTVFRADDAVKEISHRMAQKQQNAETSGYVDIALCKHSADTAPGQLRVAGSALPCNCGTIEGWTIQKHAIDCCGLSKDTAEVWLRNINLDPDYQPPSCGFSGVDMNNAMIWPHLITTVEHLVDAMRTVEWELLAPLRLIARDSPSRFITLRIKYLPSYAGHMSQFSLPSAVKSEVTKMMQEISMRGISCEVDSSFMRTPAGTAHFQMSLESMAIGITQARNLQTANFIVDIAMENSQTPPELKPRKISILDYMRNRKKTFALLNKPSGQGLHELEAWLRDKMEHQKGEFNNPNFSLLMANECVTAIRRLNENATTHEKMGERGIDELLKINRLGILDIFGKLVMSMRPFLLPPMKFIQPLEGIVEYGEYILMCNTTPPGNPYFPHTLDREMFTSRGFETVLFTDALNAMQIFEENGNIKPWDPSIGTPTGPDNNYFPYIKAGDGTMRAPEIIKELLNHPCSLNSADAYEAAVTGMFGVNIDIARSRAIQLATSILNQASKKQPNFISDEMKTIATAISKDPTDVSRWNTQDIFTEVMKLPVTKTVLLLLHKLGLPSPVGCMIIQPNKTVRADHCVATIPGRAVEVYEDPGAATVTDTENFKRRVVVEKRTNTTYCQHGVHFFIFKSVDFEDGAFKAIT